MRSVLAIGVLGLVACASSPPSRGSRYARWPDIAPSAYEHYIRGRLAIDKADHETAIAEFRMAAAVAADQPELRVAIGDELLATGQLDLARDEAIAISMAWPEEPLGWRLLGRVLAHRRDFVGATKAFERAVTFDPDDEAGYLLLAAAQHQLENDAQAEKTYRRLVSRMPTSVEGHFRLGRALLGSRHHGEAQKELARAVELDPGHIDARVALADAYRRGGDGIRAARTLREAFDRSGNDPSVGERLFRVLLETGDRGGATALLHTLDADWRDVNVRLRLAWFFLELHQADEALMISKAVLARDEKMHTARVLEARALAQLGRKREAVAVCLEVPAGANSYVDARVLAGDLDGKLGVPQEGVKIVEEALARMPGEPALVTAQAALYEKLGALDRARSLLDTALGSPSIDENLIYARASLEDRAGNPDRAVEIMRKLLEKNGDNVMALNFIGFSYAERNLDLTASEKLLRHAIELRPDDGFLLDSWGWLLLRQNRLDEATQALERADRLAPFEPEILMHLGELWLRRGDNVRAKDLFHQALSLQPDGKVKDRLEERMRTLEAKAP